MALLTVRLPDNVMEVLNNRFRLKNFKTRSDYIRWLIMQDAVLSNERWKTFLWKLSGISTVRIDRILAKSMTVDDFFSHLSNASKKLTIVPNVETDEFVSYTFELEGADRSVTVTTKRGESVTDTILQIVNNLESKLLEEVSEYDDAV